MSYYTRLCEIAAQRYDQEVARAEQAGEQRTFYFGLLGGLAAGTAAIVQQHGLVLTDNWKDHCFWAFVILACLGLAYTFIQLLFAICPQKVGYWPLPRSFRFYADGCHVFHTANGSTDADSAVIDDVERVLAKRVEEVTEHNHERNNERNVRTTRCFWGLVLTSPAVLAMFVFSLLGSPVVPTPPSTGNENVTQSQNSPSSQPANSQPGQSAPTQTPSAQAPTAPAVSRPAEPQAIYLTEGTKSAQSDSLGKDACEDRI